MCCLFGFLDYGNKLNTKQKNKIISVLSRECEERGTDATGIAFNSKNRLQIHKKPLPAHKAKLYISDNVKAVMGHTRLTTQGTENHNYNNHPFPGSVNNADFALAHNGVLRNDELLRKTEHLPETKIETDSYIAVQLIEKKQQLNFDSLKSMAESVAGTFCFTVLDDRDNLYFIKGDNPMTIYDFHTLGLIIYASTKTILDKALKKLRMHRLPHSEMKISSGDILKINPLGEIEKGRFDYDDWLYSSFYSSCCPYSQTLYNDSHVSVLKTCASYFGLDDDDIDDYLANGFTPDEIEEMMYGCSVFSGCF